MFVLEREDIPCPFLPRDHESETYYMVSKTTSVIRRLASMFPSALHIGYIWLTTFCKLLTNLQTVISRLVRPLA
jgi:hypothetical protein